jgi:thiamine pyrophosphokinase
LRAVIIAGGALPHPEQDRAHIRADDLLIAANGGARHCRGLGLRPSAVIGDFDSLDDEDLHHLRAFGAELLRHPARKDQTDLELAVRLALERGAGEILVLGALGARWDQSLANLLLAGAPGLESASLVIRDGPQEIRPLRAGDSLKLSGSPGDILSLVPIAGDALGVTTEGLEYPLIRGTLRFGSTLGISNSLVGTSARITLEQGLLLCVIFHHPMKPHIEGGSDVP